MVINYDREKLKRVVEDLANLTGIAISVLNHNFEYIASSVHCDFCSLVHKIPNGAAKCRKCDKEILDKCKQSRKTETHICHAGLLETVVSIVKNDIVLGYVFLGRMRCEEDFEKVFKKLNADNKEEFRNAYYKLQYRDDDKIKSAARLAEIITTYILTEKFINFEYDTIIASVEEYIDKNIKNEISVDSICRKLYISKSMIYKKFRNSMNCTVHEFIINKRIQNAKEYLCDLNIPISDVAEMVGINNYTYFCKLFKKRTGISPSQYRKEKSC